MFGGCPALEALGNLADWAFERLLVFVLLSDEVVTVGRGTFNVVSRVASLHNHFPLKSLPSIIILLVQKPFKVILCRKWG